MFASLIRELIDVFVSIQEHICFYSGTHSPYVCYMYKLRIIVDLLMWKLLIKPLDNFTLCLYHIPGISYAKAF